MDKGLHCPDLAAGTGTVRELFVDESNNELYAIGLLRFNGYCEEVHIISRWTGAEWEQVGEPTSYTGFTAGFFEDDLYAHGQILPNPGGSKMYRFDDSSWTLLEDQPNSTVNVMKVFGDTLFLGGTFTTLGSDTTFRVGKYRDGQFSGLTRPYPNAGTFCYAIAHYQGHLYMGGNFTLHPDDGVPQTFSNLARVVDRNVEPFGEQFLNEGTTSVIYDMEVFQDKLYVAGGFQMINGYSGNYIMTWDGESYAPVGAGPDHIIRDILVYDDELYVLGYYSQMDNNPCKYISKWTGQDWICLNQTELDNVNEADNLRAITIYNNQLIVGGGFTTVNGDSLNSVAIIDGAVGLSEQPATTSSPFDLFPNPTEGELQIKGPFELGSDYKVFVYDGLGRLVFISGRSATENQITLQLPDALSNGLYHLRVVEEGTLITQQSFARE